MKIIFTLLPYLLFFILPAFVFWVAQFYRDLKENRRLKREVVSENAKLIQDKNFFEKEKEDWERKINSECVALERQLNEERKSLEILASEKTLGFPWLAQAYADFHELAHKKEARYLETKRNPAPKAAAIIKKMSRSKRETEKKYRVYKYLIDYYESLFPWLTDFKDFEEEDLIRVDEDQPYKEVKDKAQNWLTLEEYNKLTSAKKYQLALDRYRRKKKTKWEIGRDYERYVGYCYERDGYKVDYQGIIKGFEDLGRDLIAKKNGETHIIQCKYWAKRKTIHEKHIFQLFGTTIQYFIKNFKLPNTRHQLDFFVDVLKGSNLKGVFVTSIKLSDMAKNVAETLNIQVFEDFPLKEYPIIKCNVSRTDQEKIYHLPFDQQYDNVIIEPERGEFYASTIIEAESKGFRRAYRWSGD